MKSHQMFEAVVTALTEAREAAGERLAEREAAEETVRQLQAELRSAREKASHAASAHVLATTALIEVARRAADSGPYVSGYLVSLARAALAKAGAE